MNNFVVRSLTGIFIVSAVIGSILIHPYIFLGLFALSAILLMRELEGLLCENRNLPLFINSVLMGTGMFVLSFLYFHNNIPAKWGLLLMLTVLAPFLIVLFRPTKNPFHLVANYLLIAIYISLPLFSLNVLAFAEGDYNPLLLLSFFILLWVNDTGAYIVGVNFGKNRLFERISPKKSWEGFWGGLVLTVVAAYVLFLWVHEGSMALWLITGFVVSVFATLGDLVESMLKRSANTKDSGTILPGHGGVLDRFDGALFAAPVMSLLFYLFAN